MQLKKRNIGTAAIIFGSLAGILASSVPWEELSGPAGKLAFLTIRILTGLGFISLLGFLIWAWKSDREQDRLIDRRTRFQARLEPENQTASKTASNALERQHRR
jgi:hypothetical protein